MAVATATTPDVPTAATAVGNGVQRTAATEELSGVDAIAEPETISSAGALREPVAVPGNYVSTITTCDSCNGTTPCNCHSKRKRWTWCADWWHSTHLYRKHARHLGHPGMFCERPFGVCNEGWAQAMIAAGKADRAILHNYDFICHADGTVELTPRGQRELARIAEMMTQFPVPLSIESTFDSAEDAARQKAVLDAIAAHDLPISPDSIRIAADRTIGINGLDAQAIEAIRVNEVLTGASRTQMYQDSAGAVTIPYLSGDGANQR